MHFTTGNALPRIGKRINWQLLLVVGGLAVALSVAAVAGVFNRHSSTGTTAVTEAPAPAIPATPPQAVASQATPEMTYILVGSQQQADLLESALSAEAAQIPAVAEEQDFTDVIAIETPQQQQQFDAMLAMSSNELMAANIPLVVVDLRDETPASMPTVYIVASEADKALLERELAGSDANASIFVIQRGTLDGDRLYNTIVADQMGPGNFNLVDLRN
jgi:hypothetical protein